MREESPLEGALRTLLGDEPLVQSLGDSLPAAIFVADAQGRSIYINLHLQLIFGLPAGEPGDEGWLASLHPEDRLRVLAEWADAVHRETDWQSEFRCCHPDGAIKSVAARSSPLKRRSGRVAGRVRAVEDITLRTRPQAKLSALIDASGPLLESPRLGAVPPAIMTIANNLIAADGYAVWRLFGTEDWHIVTSTGISAGFANAIIQSYGGDTVTTVPFSEPLAVEDVSTIPMLAERQRAYASEGIRSMLVAPLKIGGTLSGTLVFYYRTSQRFDEIRTRMAAALGNLAAVAIATAELYEQQLTQRERAERAHQQAVFLAEAGVALGSSLDYEGVLSPELMRARRRRVKSGRDIRGEHSDERHLQLRLVGQRVRRTTLYNGFPETRPQTTPNGCLIEKPTPFYRGRLRLTAVLFCLRSLGSRAS